jgi:HTH-type transcriptional regulator/antitoxin MqsA
MKRNTCPVCGKGTLNKELVEERFEYKDQSISIPNYLVYKCDACKETIVDKGTLKSSGKLLKNFKCKVDGLLTGDEIKEIRKKLNLTQEQMSEILGGGLKSFARYESGQVCQSRAMDNLLRILDRYPDTIHLIWKGSPYRLKGQKESSVIVKNTKVIYLDDYKTYKKKYASEQGLFILKSEDETYGS